ncbi:MAG: hypothetical protein ACI8W7_001772, partial [Gammaproteobacteria bacterium]
PVNRVRALPLISKRGSLAFACSPSCFNQRMLVWVLC